jgi:hypothetical protein
MKTPRESLKNQYTPDEIAELDLSELAEFLKLQSKGRLGQSHAKRIKRLQDAHSSSALY